VSCRLSEKANRTTCTRPVVPAAYKTSDSNVHKVHFSITYMPEAILQFVKDLNALPPRRVDRRLPEDRLYCWCYRIFRFRVNYKISFFICSKGPSRKCFGISEDLFRCAKRGPSNPELQLLGDVGCSGWSLRSEIAVVAGDLPVKEDIFHLWAL